MAILLAILILGFLLNYGAGSYWSGYGDGPYHYGGYFGIIAVVVVLWLLGVFR